MVGSIPCQAQNDHLKQCGKPARKTYTYFGDHELYWNLDEKEPHSVVVALCKEHAV